MTRKQTKNESQDSAASALTIPGCSDDDVLDADGIDNQGLAEESRQAFKHSQSLVRDAIAKADQAAVKLDPDAPKMLAVWDELQKFSDTNDLILNNLKSLQLRIQRLELRYHERVAKKDTRLKEILDWNGKEKADGELYTDDDIYDAYMQEEARFNREIDALDKSIQAGMRTAATMAKEYRQCAMQKKYMYHVTIVQKFELLVQTAIKDCVKDPPTLKRLSDRIASYMAETFPVSAGDNF